MQQIEFFFDFASPFAYLAHSPLPAIADKYGLEIVYHPIDLFEARTAAGNTGPSTPQIPNKFRYIRQDLVRWAKKYGIPFEFPAPAPGEPTIAKAQIDSSRAHKAMYYAIERGGAREFASRLWSKTYGVGGYIGDDANLRAVAQEMGWDGDELVDYANSAAAQARYEAANREAHERGIFGVPIMVIGEEMWWGNDRLGLMEEYLQAERLAAA
jgi:2-hydroxychromene-2-carboxylate isomerase